MKSGRHVDEFISTLASAILRKGRKTLFNSAFLDESTTQDIVAPFSQPGAGPSPAAGRLPWRTVLSSRRAICLSQRSLKAS